MDENPGKMMRSHLIASKYVQINDGAEIQWTNIEESFRNGDVRRYGVLEVGIVSNGAEPDSTQDLANLRAQWVGDHYLMIYCDSTGRYDGYSVPTNPDRDASGKITINGEEWDASCFRKDIEFAEYFFKQFVELGWIDVDEFTDPDWTPKTNRPEP